MRPNKPFTIILLLNLVLLVLLCFNQYCTNYNEEALNEKKEQADSLLYLNCDTSFIGYRNFIEPTLKARCYKCHASDKVIPGIHFDSYELLKPLVDKGWIWSVINQVPGYPAMPKTGAKLDVCTLKKIKTWIDDGAQDN